MATSDIQTMIFVMFAGRPARSAPTDPLQQQQAQHPASALNPVFLEPLDSTGWPEDDTNPELMKVQYTSEYPRENNKHMHTC